MIEYLDAHASRGSTIAVTRDQVVYPFAYVGWPRIEHRTRLRRTRSTRRRADAPRGRCSRRISPAPPPGSSRCARSSGPSSVTFLAPAADRDSLRRCPAPSRSSCPFQRALDGRARDRRRAHRGSPRRSRQLVLIDDGSTDGTRELLSGRDWPDNVTFVLHERNRGKGAALQTGPPARDGGLLRDSRRRSRIPRGRPRPAARTAAVRRRARRLRHAVLVEPSAYSFWYVMGNKGVTLRDERDLQLLDLRRDDLPQGDVDRALPLAAAAERGFAIEPDDRTLGRACSREGCCRRAARSVSDEPGERFAVPARLNPALCSDAGGGGNRACARFSATETRRRRTARYRQPPHGAQVDHVSITGPDFNLGAVLPPTPSESATASPGGLPPALGVPGEGQEAPMDARALLDQFFSRSEQVVAVGDFRVSVRDRGVVELGVE